MNKRDAVFFAWIIGAAHGFGVPIAYDMGLPYLLLFVAVSMLAGYGISKASETSD